ncbi:restriction endonuclease subunit S, partial [Psychrobacter sp. JCM 18901]|uniref:restriction endonuclease subunit S n=1 Tax=Psychrobacter sp. JCM 18901 TaxID=1298609 RepID=UPI0021C2F9CC
HDGFVLFQPKSNKIMPEILYYILWFSEEYFVSKRQVGTQGNLNTTIVGNTKIPLVPLSNQENLLNLINKLEKSISDSQESFNKSKELENSILNKVF